MKGYVGQRFGKLTIVEDLGYYKKEGTSIKRHYAKCKCDCGKEHIARIDQLKTGQVTSCGCYKKDICQLNGINNKKYNNFHVENKIVHVALYNSSKELICDIDDWERLKQYCWSEANGYAKTRDINTGKNTLFHQMVMNNKYIDHINGNGLDNRKCNLRLATKSQNAMNHKLRKDNSTGFTGVRKLRSGNYSARIKVGGKEINLGTFSNIEDAIKTREEAEIKYFGEYRRVV